VRTLHGGGRSRLIYGNVAARGAERVFSLASAKRANNGAPDEGNHEERIYVKAETSSVLAAFAKFAIICRRTGSFGIVCTFVSRMPPDRVSPTSCIERSTTSRTDVEEEPRTIVRRRAGRGKRRGTFSARREVRSRGNARSKPADRARNPMLMSETIRRLLARLSFAHLN